MRHGTYSIVARDPATGEGGAAVQSHWFSVGSLCVSARPGVGAVATQSVVEPAYAHGGLDRLSGGEDAGAALAAMLAADPLARLRQVAVLPASGPPVAHTGADCIAHAGHVTLPDASCQANMMAADTVPEAMAAAFTKAGGDLAARLLAALQAAEREGGDVRGRQSAALLVAPREGRAWERIVDLRVEDHGDPIAELARLVDLHRAYALATEADELMGEGRAEAAGAGYREAAALAPGSDELLFWAGLAAAQAGDLENGAEQVAEAARIHPGWRTLLERLTPEFAPAGDQVRSALDW